MRNACVKSALLMVLVMILAVSIHAETRRAVISYDISDGHDISGNWRNERNVSACLDQSGNVWVAWAQSLNSYGSTGFPFPGSPDIESWYHICYKYSDKFESLPTAQQHVVPQTVWPRDTAHGVVGTAPGDLPTTSVHEKPVIVCRPSDGAIVIISGNYGRNITRHINYEGLCYFISTDMGNTWTQKHDDSVAMGDRMHHTAAVKDGAIWVFIANGINIDVYKNVTPNTDVGSWQHVTTVAGAGSIPKVWVGDDNRFYLVGHSGGVRINRSNYAGTVWDTVGPYFDDTPPRGSNNPPYTQSVGGPSISTQEYDPAIFKFGGKWYIIDAPWNTDAYWGSWEFQWLQIYKCNGSTWGDMSVEGNWGTPWLLSSGHYPNTDGSLPETLNGYSFWWDYWPSVLVSGDKAYIFYGSLRVFDQDEWTYHIGCGRTAMIVLDDEVSEHRYDSIQAALDDASAADNVLCDSGYFPEQLSLDDPRDLTMLSYQGAKVDAGGSGKCVDITSGTITITGMTLTGGEYGLYAGPQGTSLITDSNIFGNSMWGVYNANTGANLDARGNYWGPGNGPGDSGNNDAGPAKGSGNGEVRVDDYLTGNDDCATYTPPNPVLIDIDDNDVRLFSIEGSPGGEACAVVVNEAPPFAGLNLVPKTWYVTPPPGTTAAGIRIYYSDQDVIDADVVGSESSLVIIQRQASGNWIALGKTSNNETENWVEYGTGGQMITTDWTFGLSGNPDTVPVELSVFTIE